MDETCPLCTGGRWGGGATNRARAGVACTLASKRDACRARAEHAQRPRARARAREAVAGACVLRARTVREPPQRRGRELPEERRGSQRRRHGRAARAQRRRERTRDRAALQDEQRPCAAPPSGVRAAQRESSRRHARHACVRARARVGRGPVGREPRRPRDPDRPRARPEHAPGADHGTHLSAPVFISVPFSVPVPVSAPVRAPTVAAPLYQRDLPR